MEFLTSCIITFRFYRHHCKLILQCVPRVPGVVVLKRLAIVSDELDHPDPSVPPEPPGPPVLPEPPLRPRSTCGFDFLNFSHM